MARYQFVVLSNPVQGRDGDYNDWYDQHHLGEILAIDGVVSGQRFRLVADDAGQTGGAHPYRYFTLYEIETDDLPAVVAALSDPSSRVRSDTVDLTSTGAWIFEPLGPRRGTGLDG